MTWNEWNREDVSAAFDIVDEKTLYFFGSGGVVFDVSTIVQHEVWDWLRDKFEGAVDEQARAGTDYWAACAVLNGLRMGVP